MSTIKYDVCTDICISMIKIGTLFSFLSRGPSYLVPGIFITCNLSWKVMILKTCEVDAIEQSKLPDIGIQQNGSPWKFWD